MSKGNTLLYLERNLSGTQLGWQACSIPLCSGLVDYLCCSQSRNRAQMPRALCHGEFLCLWYSPVLLLLKSHCAVHLQETIA